MKLIWLGLIGYVSLYAQSSFITQEEYAQQLYLNPRGISCAKCHGKNGEGRVIAHYIQDNKKRAFVAPSIKDVSYDEFYKALTKRIKGMPRYFLTTSEIKALYFYIHKED